MLHSRTDAEYFSFCVNLNVPSLVLRPFPKARLNVFVFPSSLVSEGQSRATKDARVCLPASAPPSLSPRCLSWRCLCLSVALTPVASRSVAPNSRQRPQTGWLQITFSSKEEKCVGEGGGGGANPPSVTKTLEATSVFNHSRKPPAAGQPDLIKRPRKHGSSTPAQGFRGAVFLTEAHASCAFTVSSQSSTKPPPRSYAAACTNLFPMTAAT